MGMTKSTGSNMKPRIIRVNGKAVALKFRIGVHTHIVEIQDAHPMELGDPKYEVLLPPGLCWDPGRHLHLARTLDELISWAHDIRTCPCEDCIEAK
jgi:methyl coenzyme M reductase subunit D